MPSKSSSSGDSEPVTSLPGWRGTLLLRGIAEGREESLEALYRACGDRFYSMALHWVRDEGMALEVVQDCFVRIWKKADRYDPARSAPFTWCCMILRGIALDHLRKNSRNPLLQDDHDLALDLASPTQVDDLFFHESLSRLREAFRHLNEDERRVINAALFDPGTTRQLAESWKLPLATAKTKIRRALLKLRDLLKTSIHLVL
ncbi:sigma-70 family RNA polymerase sigma factor (plasmid) [Verrucomicrobiaceae bacterium 227]